MSKSIDRIIIRLVRWVVIFSTVLTVVSTFGQLYYEFDMFNDSLDGPQPYGTKFVAQGWLDQNIIHHFMYLLVGNGLKIFLVAGFALAMFQYLLCHDCPEEAVLGVDRRSVRSFADGSWLKRVGLKQRRSLREHELLREAIEHVPMMIMIADADHALQYVNRSFERLTGFSRWEILGRPACIFADISKTAKEKRVAIESKLAAGEQWEGMLEMQAKCGDDLKLLSVISPVLDEENRMVNTILVSREVSSEIAMHKESVNAKKMEAVNRLTSSFAHEFGNPLFGIRSVLRDIVERVELAEEDRSLLELAYRECERIRKMVRNFQLLYRESTAVDEMQSINTILIGVLEKNGPLMSVHKVSFTLNLIDETNEVMANTAKLSLVLGKIVVNAIEAMSSTGGILQIGSFLQEEYLVISIGDAGGGIKQEHQELVFEPFFSTKPVVEGAGLGLSVAYGTMKSLGGTIMFTSEEGRGSVFNVLLPLG